MSDLYENEKSRRAVLSRAIPRTLVDKVGLDQLMKRLPEQVSAARRVTFTGAVLQRAGVFLE